MIWFTLKRIILAVMRITDSGEEQELSTGCKKYPNNWECQWRHLKPGQTYILQVFWCSGLLDVQWACHLLSRLYSCWCYFLCPKYHFFFSSFGKSLLIPQGQAQMLLLGKAYFCDPGDTQCFFCYSSTVTLWMWHKLGKQKENRTRDAKVVRHCRQLLYITLC